MVITLNAESVITECLHSLQFCNEVVVVDSGSTDETLAIAGQFTNVRIVHQQWLGYGPQKQFAVKQATHDWVLCLDADERVSHPLKQEIEQLLATPERANHAYEFPRCNRFMGRWLRHGEGYPDPNLRLYDRRHGRWSSDPVHEHVIADGPVGRLRGDLLHLSEQGLEDYLAKQNRYTTIQAQRLAAQGKNIRAHKLWLSPGLRFLKFFFLRAGFLDGVPGLVHIAIGCFNTLIKYAKARAIQRRQTPDKTS
ncbi:putative glycosyl transferase family protein [Magnetofaba australis IT-1]|uniref:Putative glycosyl transferase family protein n=1 Tax=Magnetofaba australis IT-1 TaxID=1434232 RepID=A0A1Y2K5H6_9PROT|nr:putative glycosyl transferase family protein [Magnetofaba australis IT-1]